MKTMLIQINAAWWVVLCHLVRIRLFVVLMPHLEHLHILVHVSIMRGFLFNSIIYSFLHFRSVIWIVHHIFCSYTLPDSLLVLLFFPLFQIDFYPKFFLFFSAKISLILYNNLKMRLSCLAIFYNKFKEMETYAFPIWLLSTLFSCNKLHLTFNCFTVLSM